MLPAISRASGKPGTERGRPPLPVARSANGEVGDQADVEPLAARPGGNETILLVEDEKSIRVTTAGLFLKAFGYAHCALRARRVNSALGNTDRFYPTMRG